MTGARGTTTIALKDESLTTDGAPTWYVCHLPTACERAKRTKPRVSPIDYPHIVSLSDLLTADVTTPGAGADLLRTIYAPNLTDVRLDGFRAHHFEGRWEEHLTEPLSETVRRLSARSPNLFGVLAFLSFFLFFVLTFVYIK